MGVTYRFALVLVGLWIFTVLGAYVVGTQELSWSRLTLNLADNVLWGPRWDHLWWFAAVAVGGAAGVPQIAGQAIPVVAEAVGDYALQAPQGLGGPRRRGGLVAAALPCLFAWLRGARE